MAQSPFDCSIFAKRDQFKRLAWLGRHDWLRPTAMGDRQIKLDLNFPQNDGRISAEDYQSLNRSIEFAKQSNLLTEMIWHWGISKLFYLGPKLFRPTREQCDAMCQVSIDIPLVEYNQPYPVIIFEYPESFCQSMMENLGCSRFPKVAVCHHDDENKFIHVTSLFSSIGDGITALLPSRGGETVEDILSRRANDKEDMNESEFKMGEMLQRIALNFSLLMTHFRTSTVPLDPDAREKYRRLARKENQKKRDRAQSFVLSDVSLIQFEQNIDFYDTQAIGNGESESTGRHVKPHWRRGHWRMQAHGHQFSLRKRLFVKPLMVRKEMFVGEMSNTTVVYNGIEGR